LEKTGQAFTMKSFLRRGNSFQKPVHVTGWSSTKQPPRGKTHIAVRIINSTTQTAVSWKTMLL